MAAAFRGPERGYGVSRMPRSRVIALLLAAIAAAVALGWLRPWVTASVSQVRTADYTMNYVAATMWRHGDAAWLYDGAAQVDAGRALGFTGAQFAGNRFSEPPLAAVAMAPFSLLDLSASYRAWGALQLLLMVAAVVVVARAAPWPRGLPRVVPVSAAMLGLAGAGTAVLLLQAQSDGFSCLGVAVAFACWRRQRAFAGGAVLAAASLLAKPHLALVLAAWMLGRRDRRMLAGAAAGAASLAVLTLALAGPAAVAGFLEAPGLSTAVTPARMLLGFTGLFTSWLGDGGVAYALAAAAGLAAVVAGAILGDRTRRGRASLETSLAAATVLSLLASPHLLVQDLSVLVAPFIWVLARAAALDGPRAWPGPRTLSLVVAWAALDLAARLDLGNYAAAPPGRLVPAALVVVLAAALVAARATRRSDLRVPVFGVR